MTTVLDEQVQADEAVETVVFTSGPRLRYLAIKVPEYSRLDEASRTVVRVQDEVAADFAPDGRFETDDPSMIEWLRGHSDYGLMFVEEGREPGRPLPTDEDFAAAVIGASAELDDERLRELLDEEQNTHARPNLIAMVKAAQERVGAIKASVVSGDGS